MQSLGAQLDGGRLPGLTYELIMEGASNGNGVRGTPVPMYGFNTARCRRVALLIVWARKKGDCAFLRQIGKDVYVDCEACLQHTQRDGVGCIH
jgi:hypothetical protein